MSWHKRFPTSECTLKLSALKQEKLWMPLCNLWVCVSGSSYLIRDAAVVVVPHADPHWTLYFIRGCPRCVVTLSIWTHFHILMDDSYDTQTKTVTVRNSAVILLLFSFATLGVSCTFCPPLSLSPCFHHRTHFIVVFFSPILVSQSRVSNLDYRLHH